MICKKCNFQNEETAKFCRNCGAELKKNSNLNMVWMLFAISVIVCTVLGTLLFVRDKSVEFKEEDVFLSEPQNSRTYDRGVIINGTKWATRNIDERGTFVSQLHHLGNGYTWDEAKNVCPAGWRLPTKDEIEDLLRAPNKLTTINGVNGIEFGTPPNNIFFPIVEDKKYLNNYWSNTPYRGEENGFFYSLLLSNTGNYLAHTKGGYLPVRAVAE